MKVKKSDINLLIMLIGVLLAVLSYFVLYKDYTQKTATIQAENTVLQSEVDGLQQLADNKDHYIAETARMDNEIKEIMARYPAEVRTEDQVVYTINLEQKHSIWVENMASEDTHMVQVAAATPEAAAPTNDAVVAADGAEAPAQDAVVASNGLKDTVFLYSSPFNIGFKTTYRSAKDIIAGIVNSDERMNIQSLTLSYDAKTGCLTGTLDATMYTMSGTDAVYEEISLPGVSTGSADLFKSGAVLNLNANIQSGDAVAGDAADTTEETEETEESEE